MKTMFKVTPTEIVITPIKVTRTTKLKTFYFDGSVEVSVESKFVFETYQEAKQWLFKDELNMLGFYEESLQKCLERINKILEL